MIVRSGQRIVIPPQRCINAALVRAEARHGGKTRGTQESACEPQFADGVEIPGQLRTGINVPVTDFADSKMNQKSRCEGMVNT